MHKAGSNPPASRFMTKRSSGVAGARHPLVADPIAPSAASEMQKRSSAGGALSP